MWNIFLGHPVHNTVIWDNIGNDASIKSAKIARKKSVSGTLPKLIRIFLIVRQQKTV